MDNPTSVWVGRIAIALACCALTCAASDEWDDPLRAVLEPPWQVGCIRREIVAFIQDREGAPATARLIAAPHEVLSLRQAAWPTGTPRTWRPGTDVRVDGARLEAVDPSIPSYARFAASGVRCIVTAGGCKPRTRIALPTDNPMWAEDPWSQVVTPPPSGEQELRGLGMSNNEDQLVQVEVVYRTAAPWTSWRPLAAGPAFAPALQAKLAARTPVRLVFFGDSITEGLGSSGHGGSASFAPGRPGWAALAGAALARAYRYPDPAAVTVDNRAHAGHSLGNLQQPGLQIAELERADLVVIAYGMNDSRNGLHGKNLDRVAQFVAMLKERMTIIRTLAPEVPVVVVAPMLGNPEWARTGYPYFAALEQALPAAVAADRHVAVLDLTRLWIDLLAAKGWTPEDQAQGKQLCGWYDLAANRLNHPNDAGHLLYAQGIVGLIGVPAAGP